MDKADRPNIVWIVSEDCPPWLGCYGDELAHTPNLDRLAERGVLYERAYCTTPVCAPSRFSLLTGIAPESHSPADRMRAQAPLPHQLRTYPELLRDAGYYCTNNAKTDYNADVDPDAIWDESSRTAHWRSRPAGAPFLAVFNYDATHESVVFASEGPFAELIPRVRVADPVDPDDIRVPAYLPDTPEIRADFATYYGFVAQMDAFVGEILAQLREDGLDDDTVVLYTSDHGGVTPRSKRYLYEQGTRVPLIVAAPPRWAQLLPEPRVVSEPVTTLSMAPTLLTLAGVAVPDHMQAPALGDPPRGAGHAFSQRGRMDERFSLVRSVRSRRFRYLRNYTPHRPTIQHQAFAWCAAGYRSWEREHLAGRLDTAQEPWWQEAPPIELYDLDADPDEVCNLAGDPAVAGIEAELAERLRAHMREVNDNGFLPEDSDVCGWEASRVPGAYPLERILEIADAGLDRDVRNVPRFVAALADADPTVRRWAAIGLLALAPAEGPADAADAVRTAVPILRRGVVGDIPSVAVPAAEALARIDGDELAYAQLAALAADEQSTIVRLEAINALTFLDLERVRAYSDVVEAAASAPHEYLGSAGRYLRFRLDGTYTPQSPVFSVEALMTLAAGTG